jgi:hypothetical protein
MSTSTAPTLPFPHPVLTPISGEPTNTSLQLLQQELFANARAIFSTRGGGANGHLALVMPAPDYLTRAAHVFTMPIHPGDAPVHLPAATSAQITETNRQYAADLYEHTRVLTIAEELKKQLLQAVHARYLRALADPDFGFADVSPAALLAHLKTTYGVITREELETNRARLSAEWNPDSPLEDLWLRIAEIQRFALAGGPNNAIPDDTVLSLLLPVFEKTGVFTTACEKWRDFDDATWTLVRFKLHFTKANAERKRKLTAQGAGYAGAAQHGAGTRQPSGTPTPPPATPPPVCSPVGSACPMYYCWTHGLGKNRAHTGVTCNRKAPGHQDTATADNLMGGNNTIMRGSTRAAPPRE